MLTRLRLSLTAAAGAALLGAAACARGGDAAGPHAAVACVGCHRGVAADSGRAPVPDGGCSDRGCHRDGGPDSARLLMVGFTHRAHPDGRGGAVPCAACHTHAPGSTTMAVDTTACALCHVTDLAEWAGRQPDCRSCHPAPGNSHATNQGVPIDHAQLDLARVSCTRCHYQVMEGSAHRVRSCRQCHADTTLVAFGADSVHAAHPSYQCATCHEPVRHRVAAMSSSVSLNCLDCHSPQHRRANHPANVVPGVRCAGCHTDAHAAEQRLILGLLPGEPIRPSPMFLGGVTCRSCHVVPGQPTALRTLRSNEAACTGCHGRQWTGYLGRWRRGYQRREAWVTGYIAQAAAALADSARFGAARAQVRRAQGLIGFLRSAGPLHNLPATDRIMRDALDQTARAYALAGRAAPPRPELGPPVQPASCMSCHYGIEEVGGARDSVRGRRLSHADHLFRAYLACDACHAAGATPPGLPDSLWIDTTRLERGGPPSRRRNS